MSRRTARERALQILYSVEIADCGVDGAIKSDYFNKKVDELDREFVQSLVFGSYKNRSEIDEFIKKYAREWRIERLACIDRNIMRIAIYEMIYEDEIPYDVSINEAVELAKKFSTEKAAGFINGILDGVKHELLQSNTDSG